MGQIFIDGKWLAAVTAETMPVFAALCSKHTFGYLRTAESLALFCRDGPPTLNFDPAPEARPYP